VRRIHLMFVKLIVETNKLQMLSLKSNETLTDVLRSSVF
jgi:hypothetical protein